MLKPLRKILDLSLFRRRFVTPPFLIFFITSKCNLMCSHCFYWKNLNKTKDMTLEEIKRLSLNLNELDSLLLSGGEPFLRKDLGEIVKIFFENNNLQTLTIPTNGFLTEQIFKTTKRILKVASGRNFWLNFSLDGSEKVHDQIRGVKGSFKKTLTSLEAVIPLKEEYSNFRIQVCSTISQKNYHDLFNLIDELIPLSSKIDGFNLALLRGGPKDTSLKLPPEKQLVKLREYADERFPHFPFLTRYLEKKIFSLALSVVSEKKQIVPCQAGRLMGVVAENGDVRPCELLPPIGNLRKNSFLDIWNSSPAKQAREKIRNRKCFCTQENCLFASLLANPLYFLK